MVGAKNDKEFYAMFPNTPEGEEMFMAKYGKKIKSLQLGAKITAAQNGLALPPTMQGLNYTFGQYSNEPQGLGYNLSGNPNGQMYNIGEGAGGIRPLSGPSMQQTANTNTMGNNPKFDIMGKLKDNINLPGKIVQGIQSIKEEKKERQRAEQWRDVSNVTLAASQTKPEQTRRRYARPEDMIIQPGELNNPYGESYAKNGTVIPKAAGGFTSFLNAGGSDMIDNTTDWMYGDNAGSQLGGDLGGAVGNIFGPVGGMVGKEVGKLAGWALDRNPQKIKKANAIFDQNVNNMAFGNQSRGVQQQYSSYMEDGGYINNDWQPQVITKFGDHSMRSLLAPDKSMDTLRTGGNLRRNSSDMEQSGELQTYWGGHAEPISENPYLPDGGQMIEFRGNSHEESDGRGRTGIGMSFGDRPVEVERGEPAVKLADGGSEEALTVFGNMPISKEGAKLLNDPDAANMKFKGYTKRLADKTDKVNKLVEKSTDKINDLQVITSFDKLTLASLGANIMGSNMKLKDYANKIQKAAYLQQAINDTAEERGLVADDLARGRIKKAQTGTNIVPAEPNLMSRFMSGTKEFLSDAGTVLSESVQNILNDKTDPHKPVKAYVPPKNMTEVWQEIRGTRDKSNFPNYTPPTSMKEVWQDIIGTRYANADTTGTKKLAGGDTIGQYNLTKPNEDPTGWLSREVARRFPEAHQFITTLGAMTNTNPLGVAEFATEMTDIPYLYRLATGQEENQAGALGLMAGPAMAGLRGAARVAASVDKSIAKGVTKGVKPVAEKVTTEAVEKTAKAAPKEKGVLKSVEATPERAKEIQAMLKEDKRIEKKIAGITREKYMNDPKIREDVLNNWSDAEKEALESKFTGKRASSSRPSLDNLGHARKTSKEKEEIETAYDEAFPDAEVSKSAGSIGWGWPTAGVAGAGAIGAGIYGARHANDNIKSKADPRKIPTNFDNPYINRFPNYPNTPKLQNGDNVVSDIPPWLTTPVYKPWQMEGWRMPGLKDAGKMTPEEVKKAIEIGQKKPVGKGKGSAKQEDVIDISQMNLTPYIEDKVDISGMNLTPHLVNKPYIESESVSQDNNFPWVNALNSMVPWFRPSDAEHLDPRQLAGEMYAMSTNQLEPVQAQSYEPRLRTPYKVSFQDQMNEVIAQSRAARKATGYNPAAQASIAAQSYAPMSNIQANEFRTNQGIADQVYAGNLATLNEAQLKNLGIFDQQYQRQEGAKSITKATNIEALKSISDKFLKNQMESRTLQTMENMYGYRFGPGMRAVNWNQPAQFNTTVGQDARTTATGVMKNDKGEDLLPILDRNGNVSGYRVKEDEKDTKRGRPVKSMNGSIIRAIKNL